MIASYVDRVARVVEEDTGVSRWNLLASNGGYLRAEQARRQPARLLLSGLAGGVIGARFFAAAAGYPSVFSLDMGGTSCDFGLVLEGEEQYAAEFELAWGIPVSVPCVAVRTIGAGGGSWPGSTAAACCTSARGAQARSPGRSPTARAVPSRR